MATKAQTLLKDYRAKRDFAKTQEPSGAGGARQGDAKSLMFVVQKHDATRLHYDFRIELDGVLKSWAVTKGPSDNPQDKRLAVRVEDHPVDYGDFEGTIPAGEYGGGTVMVWDIGTWEPIGDPHEGLENGDLKMRLHGSRLKGEWVLVHMKGRDTRRKSGPDRENWLLIKHRDNFARDEGDLTAQFTTSVLTGRDIEGIAKGDKPRKTTDTPTEAVWHSEPEKAGKTAKGIARPVENQPAFQPPQLATLVSDVPDGPDWLFEMKYDGYRCLASAAGSSVRLFTRNGNDWTGRFGVLVEPLSHLTKGTALIDGEICAFDQHGRTDFSTLKDALSNGGALVYFAFDLLELDGEDLRKLPLVERKGRLQKLLGKIETSSPIQFSDHIAGSGKQVFQALCQGGFEGVIAKRKDAPYRNDRSPDWLKVKCVKRQEFVIGGWSPSEKKRTFASLLLGTWDGDKLVYRGRVGTGFNTEEAGALQARLDALVQKDNPFDAVPRSVSRSAHWVKPTLVGEVAFTEFTPDGILRHPSFMGLREDKPARDIHLEIPKDVEEAVSDARPEKAPARRTVALTDDAGIKAAEAAGIRLTSPERILYPDQKVTKAELVAYYAAVADRMLPYIAGRPLSLLRCPQGRTKYCFFQKHNTGGFPEAMRSVEITENSGETEDYFYIEDLQGLIAGTQMNVLEWHLWGAHKDDIEHPERIIFDIDPDEGMDWLDVRQAARDIAGVLDALGLQSFPMVSGGKGIHVIAPIVPKAGWDEVKALCKGVAMSMAQREPDRFTATMSKAKRKGKMFIDYLRNERGSTAVSPYSARSRVGAPVAVPVGWDELETIEAANAFGLEAAAARAGEPDPWADYFKLQQTITAKMLDAVSR